jgi:hypothetical protein
LLGGARPDPIPDSEVPVDSSDFLDDRKKGASPKAPPVRRPAEPKFDVKEPPKGGMQLKLKEPPAPPKQKPRPPMRSDDVSDDLLSADVGFEGLPPPAEAPRLLAPDALALAAPPPESKPPAAPAPAEPAGNEPSPSASKARPKDAAPAKSSRWIPIALLSIGAVGAFAMAFRSQLKDGAPPKPEPAADEHANAVPPPPPTNVVPPMPPPIERPGATETASAAAPAALAPSATTPSVTTPAATTRVTAASTSKSGSAPVPTGASSAGPKPGSSAPAPGATEAPAEPRAAAEGPFNADAARTALAAAVAQASSCRKPGDPSGVAAVTITFSPSGRVTSANIAGPPFAGTPTGGCIAATLRRARVPAFTGDMVTVRKTVEIQ